MGFIDGGQEVGGDARLDHVPPVVLDRRQVD